MLDLILSPRAILIYHVFSGFLSSLIVLFFFLSYLESREIGKIFLALSFTAFALHYILHSIQILTNVAGVALDLSGRWVEAVGLVLISYVIVKQLVQSETFSSWYLIGSFVLTSLFAVVCFATVDFNIPSYNLHWTELVWSVVQAVVFGFLTIPIFLSWLKMRQAGIAAFTVVFFLWSFSRLLHLINHLFFQYKLRLIIASEKMIELLALFLLLGYALHRFYLKGEPKPKT